MCYKELFISAVILLLLDSIYIYSTSNMYKNQILNVQGSDIQIRPVSVVICYLFIILGLYYFILRKKRPSWEAFLLGAVIYGVYDATNHATIKKWSPYLATTDVIWGGMLFLITTELTYKITH
jgi:uncharacterized membrane protein